MSRRSARSCTPTIEIQIDEHQTWLDRLQQDKCRIAFAVVDDSIGPIGMVSVSELDWRHRKADWAFYLTETERGGLGAALELLCWISSLTGLAWRS